MEALECLMTRRSVRKYSDKPVEKDLIKKIIEAGAMAPNAAGKMSETLVAVTDPDTVAQLSKMNAAVWGKDVDPFYGAKSLIIVFADLSTIALSELDAASAMANLGNAAHAVGVDSCWINRAQPMFASEEGKALMAKWGVPATCSGIGICVLGYGEGDYPAAKARREGMIIYAD